MGVLFTQQPLEELILPKIESPKLMVNRKLEVEELNLRGLSSSESDHVTELPQNNKQNRIRKLFNSFKEDEVGPLHGDSVPANFNPLSQLRASEGSSSKRRWQRSSQKYTPSR